MGTKLTIHDHIGFGATFSKEDVLRISSALSSLDETTLLEALKYANREPACRQVKIPDSLGDVQFYGFQFTSEGLVASYSCKSYIKAYDSYSYYQLSVYWIFGAPFAVLDSLK